MIGTVNAFVLSWINLFQAWSDDRYCWTQNFDTCKTNLDLDSKSQECKKVERSAPVISRRLMTLWPPSVYIIHSSDLYCKTANESHWCPELGDLDPDFRHISSPIRVDGKSEHTVLNNHNILFLSMSTTFDLCILNDVCDGDLQGRYTYISNIGNNVNDYFLLSLKFSRWYRPNGLLENGHMPV